MKSTHNVISSENVLNYVDSTTDGGYWYTIEDGVPVFKTVTPKALKIFGYESTEEMIACGRNPYNCVLPINPNMDCQRKYEALVTGETEKFHTEAVFVDKEGNQQYGEIIVARSFIYEGKNEPSAYRAMMLIFDQSMPIFEQSRILLDKVSTAVSIFKEVKENVFEYKYGNEYFLKMLEYPVESWNVMGRKYLREFVEPADAGIVENIIIRARENKCCERAIYRLLDKNGNYVWVTADHQHVIIGKNSYVYISFMNVTNLMIIQEDIKKSNKSLEHIINAMPSGITVFNKALGKDEYKLTAINDTFVNKINSYAKCGSKNKEYMSKDQYTGKAMSALNKLVEEVYLPKLMETIKSAEENRVGEYNFKVHSGPLTANGDVWIHSKLVTRIRKNGDLQLIMAFDDITKQVNAELELKKRQIEIMNLSYHDALTGVLNRASYNEYMDIRGLVKHKDTGVSFLDLNGLKVINDTIGHGKGDEALKSVANRILHYFNKNEVYRLSGDNFVIIKENIPANDFFDRMGKLSKELEKDELASMGYKWETEVTNIAHNIDKAEEAMRVAKQEYYLHHNEDMSKKRSHHLNDIIADINSGKFIMYLQPKAYTHDSKIVGAEALIRMKDENGGILSPIQFVPLYEKEKIVIFLDFFMLKEVCRVLEKWNKSGRAGYKVSVNMSRVTFAEPNYIEKVLDLTDRYQVDRSQIEFEVTESSETMDRLTLEGILVELQKLGFGVSLDDLGTEYSSLQMLLMDGIDTVKIDRSFVMQLGKKSGKVMVQHIIDICHELGKVCIAEGVEEHEIRQKLCNMGCDMYQGYLLSKPVPEEEFEKLM